MAADFHTIVVGGGVVGLAIAHALAKQAPSVLLLERHEALGTETTSRNSEVIHSGIYYPQGSLRAALCVRGRPQLYRFAAENGVATERCGKLIVATSAAETDALKALKENGEKNGVEGLALLSATEAKRLESALACKAALLSPVTGIVDAHGLVVALEGGFTSAGGEVVLNSAVDAIAKENGSFTLDVADRQGGTARITAERLVLAAGLEATRLGRMLRYPSGYQVPVTRYGKGHYFAFSGKAPFQHLIYPMPSGAWLGTHFTRDLSGRGKFGPDLEWTDHVDYSFDDANEARKAAFESAVRRYWPALPEGALTPDYVGIRPKIYAQGEPAADFAIDGPETHGIAGLIALYGIESPGLTSSLAIGDFVAKMAASGA
ncbi:NAD(P)/FAD-dependent oxidoreductase [Methyloligella sp. 2.7D]|uniref:NAD(P)/FAD-dependent oxidoreductase n=1 Tax=unclassified Methyloligella TaxID=2625955 RepID=UPI00157BD669|nr:NAD(P)/FAD-dependent oxidoreductase [Methyloligella sp. GL2]QKP77691.1 NAD(P)/FAD-dependent oxidoreductase [Methyloligella sp. GL2]